MTTRRSGSRTMVISPITLAATVRITRDLGLSAVVLGVVLAAYPVGTVAGALSATRLRARMTRRRSCWRASSGWVWA